MSSAIIKNAVIVVGVEQGRVNFKLPDLSPLLKAMQKEIGLIRDTQKVSRELSNQRSKQARLRFRLTQKNIEAERKARQAVKELGDESKRSFSEVAGSVQSAVTGIGQLARGFVLLGGAGERDLRKVIDALILVQGSIDALSGGVAVLVLLEKAMEGFTVATLAARVAALKLYVAAAPLIVLFSAAAAAVAVLAGGYFFLTQNTDGNTEATKKNTAATEANIRKIVEINGIRRRLAGVDATVVSVDAAREKIKLLDEEKKRIDDLFRSYDRFKDALAEGDEVKLAFSSARLQREGFDAEESAQRLIDLELERSRAKETVARGEARIRQEQIQTLNDRRTKEKQILDLAKEQLRVQADQLKSSQEALGRAGPGARARLEFLAKKVEGGGKLNQNDLEFVERFGGRLSEFAQGKFVEQGRGVAGFAKRITGKDAIQQQEADGGLKGFKGSVESFLKANNELFEEALKQIERLARKVEMIDDELVKAGA